MASVQASLQIDRNHKTIQTNEAILTRKTVTFDGTANNGAVASPTISLFTVTGDVLGSTFGVCSEDLVGATATLALGVVGATAVIIAATTATDIDSGESWVDAAPGIGEAPTATRIYPRGADVVATVATADITDGTLTFYCLWRPLSADGNIVAA